ncbi:MAG: SurA N-terminal domain-containing protein [Chloroflexi bacterium]|nr:SurA N-terminal domain-containing protein [Chloroflexota bacterium]
MERQRILAANLGRRNRGSNLQREKGRQRVAIGIAVVVVLLVIAIPIYGWVTTFVLPPREVIVRVNDVEYDMGYLVKLMRMVQRQTEAGGQTVNLGTVPFQLVQDLATNELIVQGAQARGIQVTDEELDAELRLRVLGPVDPESTSTPAEIETEFQETYRQFLNQVQVTDDEYRDIVARDMYRIRLEEVLGETVPKEQEHVHLYALAVQTQEDVEEIRTKFARGSTFTELVEEYAQDPETLRREGEVDWVPRGVLEEGVGGYIFDELQVGELSEGIPDFDPNTGQDYFIIYYVPEREASRTVSEQNLESLQSKVVSDWVIEERNRQDVVTDFDSTQYAWLAKKLRLTTIIPTPAAR